MDCSGRHLTPAGNRREWETPQAYPRRLPSLPAESKCLQRKSTEKVYDPKTTINAKTAYL
ncbi:hypothetical protein CYJ36_02210 [Bacillus sp. UMB0893]|nr:hypothetical protein CYJ36_02210 [Bacillus sp. UMB0893]